MTTYINEELNRKYKLGYNHGVILGVILGVIICSGIVLALIFSDLLKVTL